MFPLSALPRCISLRSKHDKQSYLRTVYDESHGGNIVELSGGADDGGVMNPRSRFYLEPSKEHDGLIHVRCCYNNKYWVPQKRVLHLHGSSSSPSWIIGTTDKPEEDLSNPSCTLFKHSAVAGEEEDGSTCRFLHSQLGRYVAVLSSTTSDTSTMRPYLHIAAHEEEEACLQHNDDLIDAFTVIDVSDQKQLPTYVAFKGDNGKFLAGVIPGTTFKYLQFSRDDIGDERVLQTVFTNNDGVVRIKNNHFDLYWKRSPNWIRADSDDTTHGNPDTLFRVITGDDFVALQNLGNNHFCKRLTYDGNTNCLNADVGSITKEARLQCYEPLVSRRMYGIDFRLDEAKIYTTGVKGLDSQIVENDTDTTIKSTLAFKYINTVESTWSSTVSMKIGISVQLESQVPLVINEKISMSTEFSASYNWGATKSDTEETTKQVDIEVPPMTKMTIKAIGSNGVCDIPFSYKQKDMLLNGHEFIHEFTDGLYAGVKTSEIKFQITKEDLHKD